MIAFWFKISLNETTPEAELDTGGSVKWSKRFVGLSFPHKSHSLYYHYILPSQTNFDKIKNHFNRTNVQDMWVGAHICWRMHSLSLDLHNNSSTFFVLRATISLLPSYFHLRLNSAMEKVTIEDCMDLFIPLNPIIIIIFGKIMSDIDGLTYT